MKHFAHFEGTTSERRGYMKMRDQKHPYLKEKWDYEQFDATDFYYRHDDDSNQVRAIKNTVFSKEPGSAQNRTKLFSKLGLPDLPRGSSLSFITAALQATPEEFESDEENFNKYLYRIGSPDSYAVICIVSAEYGLNTVYIIPSDIYDTLHSKQSYRQGEKPLRPESPAVDMSSLQKVSLFTLKGEFLKDRNRVGGMFNILRGQVGSIRKVDLVFENGIELSNVSIEGEEFVIIPGSLMEETVSTVSLPDRERQTALKPMTAKRKKSTS